MDTKKLIKDALDGQEAGGFLLGAIEDKPSVEVEAQDMDAFLDTIARLPSNAIKRFGDADGDMPSAVNGPRWRDASPLIQSIPTPSQ